MMHLTRRALMKGALLGAGGLLLDGCSPGTGYPRLGPAVGTQADSPFARLLQQASFAANSHNTQPWRFTGDETDLRLQADPSRACPAADPDRHHLYMSLGCACENLLQAAPGLGWHADATFGAEGAIRFQLDKREPLPCSPLAAAIPRRQSCRRLYEPAPLPSGLEHELNRLTPPGQRIQLITSRQQIDALAERSAEAAARQMASPSFRQELLHWLRFSEAAYLERRDGLFTGCSGNPVLPVEWLGRRLFAWWTDGRSEGHRVSEQLRASSALLLLWSDGDDKHSWIQAGRLYQRLSLHLTARGLAQAPVNAVLELADSRRDLARDWQTRERPNMLLRLGHANPLPYSLRRPWQAIWQPADAQSGQAG